MTVDLHVGALLTGVHSVLTAAAPANTDVYALNVPAGAVRPYWLTILVGGGDLNFSRQRDAEIVLQTKCVAESLAEAMHGASLIDAALDGKGEQEVATGYINGGGYWIVTTATADTGGLFMIPEFLNDEQKTIYHVGKTYRYVMEAR